jgi:hypothetical protein
MNILKRVPYLSSAAQTRPVLRAIRTAGTAASSPDGQAENPCPSVQISDSMSSLVPDRQAAGTVRHDSVDANLARARTSRGEFSFDFKGRSLSGIH